MIKYFLFFILFFSSLFADNISKGKELYLIHCANCHSIHMTGGMGKDFNIVSYSRHKNDIKKYMTAPWKYFKSFGYTSNAMPTLPLTEDETDYISDFIDDLQHFKKWQKK
jgi:mono/diheme cytochrome c family protein